MRALIVSPALLAFAAVLFAPVALAAKTPNSAAAIIRHHADQVLVGTVYSKGADQTVLYTFRREPEHKGDTLHVTRTYSYPDGRVAVIEKATYKKGNLVSYTLIQKQTGARGKVTIEGNAFKGKGVAHFSFTKDGDHETDSEELEGPTVINDSIVPYMRAHWDELMAGDELDIRYLVIPRLETVGFTLSKSGKDTWNGNKVVTIKMDPTSFFIGLAVDPVFFTFDKGTTELIQYTGRTSPKIKEDGEWENLDAVTTFHWEPAKQAK